MFTVNDLLKGDIKLASPPAIYLALTKVLDDPTKNVKDAAFIIESDAALAIRLLRIVNSAFYGLPRKVDSISTAITLIGSRELRNLALATTVIERFSDFPSHLLSMQDFWEKSLRCALIVRELDALIGKAFGDTAFLCGLLHNIGLLVLYRRLPDLTREAALLIHAQGDESRDEAAVEQKVIGLDRFQVGVGLCQLWHLPDVVTESIALHACADDTGQYSVIADITRIAHLLSQRELPGAAMHLNGLGLTTEQIQSLLNRINDDFNAIFQLFYSSR